MRWAVLLGCLAAGSFPAWGATAGATIEQQRTAYKAARAAIHRGRDRVADALLPGLEDYPLYPYLLYARLRRNLVSAEPSKIQAFLKRYPELPVARLLRARWLRVLGKRGDWKLFEAADDPELADAELRCFRLQADLAAGRPAPFDAETQDLWYVGESQEDACDPVFAHWRSLGVLDDRTHRERIKLAIEAGEYGIARYLSRRLPAGERQRIETWLGAFRRPAAILPKWPGDDSDTDLLAAAMRRVARRDSDLVYRLWPDVKEHFKGHEGLGQSVRREMALFRAADYAPDAASELDRLPAQVQDQQILEWRVRVALSESDWKAVLRAVARMETGYRGRNRWRYWRARSLEALGIKQESEREFRAIAQASDYYGFLAADQLGLPYQLCPEQEPVEAPMAPAVEAALVRALELFRVDQPVDANREWHAALAGADPETGIAAGLRASRAGWHHQAILTLADHGALNRFKERFPLVWESTVASAAGAASLPQSLVFAVMRSESALRPDAVSSAGALGLMQLTPETARRVARRTGQPAPSRKSLFDPDTNIRLGAAFLKELYAQYQHPLLALAAYNAGPEVVDRWLDEDRLPVAADQWIETLPFYETRDYIPRVLAFQSIYEWRLHDQSTRLRGNMLPLDERSGMPVWSRVPRTEVRCDPP